MESRIVAVYTDGGVIGPNPSCKGGTWAYCFVDGEDCRIVEESGLLRPNEGDNPDFNITNNQTEYYAVLQALLALPNGWSGTLYSDSQITLGRVFKGWKCTNIPLAWMTALAFEKQRLGAIRPILLNGHPTYDHLARGKGHGGLPVSHHNVWCDEACTKAGM